MLAFAHIQKTAGTTVSRILRRSFGLGHWDVEPWIQGDDYFDTVYSADDHRWVAHLHPSLDSIAGHQVKPFSDVGQICPDIQYFTFLRDPVRRTASHFQHMKQRMGYEESFGTWIGNEVMHDVQTRHLCGTDDADHAIAILENRCFFVGLLECFDESMVLLRRKVGHERLDIRYVARNRAPRSEISRSLLQDPEARAKLEAANRADSKVFAYVRDELFPQQRRESAKGLEDELQRFQARNQTPPRSNLRSIANLARRNLVYKPLLRVGRTLKG